MPVCFQLYPKGSEKPIVLQRLDEELCNHFGVPVDPKNWFNDWYNAIGLPLACGKTFEQIREKLGEYIAEDKQRGDQFMLEMDETMVKIIDYLNERYTTNSFYSPFKD